METLQVECIASPMQILADEGYEVRKLINWKNKIIILPVQIGKRWVIYDKLKKEIKYEKFCSDCYRVAEAVLSEDILILFSLSINNPIIVIDIQKRRIIQKIDFSISALGSDEGMGVWSAKVNRDGIYFFIQNSFFFGCLNQNGLSLIQIKVNEPLACADFCEDAGWAVTCCGKYLYHFDKEGNVLGKYLAEQGIAFTRIIAENKKIFLFPLVEGEIRVFDVENELFKKIGTLHKNKVSGYLEFSNLPAYWGYVKKNLKMWFLPLKYPFQIIDLDTLTWEEKVLEYTDGFSEDKYEAYCRYVRNIKGFIFSENSSNRKLKKYFELVDRNSVLLTQRGEETNGDIIWKTVR